MARPHDIPETMQAVLLREHHESVEDALSGLEVVERPVPRPGHGEVLVRMAAAPVNPSDVLLLQGLYGSRKKLPAVPGWEGAGSVVASGGGWLGRGLVGRRVACGGQSEGDGTWAEYHVARARRCIVLRKDIDLEQGATSIVNPLTALGLLDAIRRGRHAAAVQTAALSQVGRMMTRLCRGAGIPLIHVVRRQEQVDELRSLGEPHVLDSSRDGFAAELRALGRDLNATIAFDSVAGGMTGILVGALPAGATVVVYGSLSLEPCRGIDPIAVIFAEKRVEGFYLGDWIERKSLPVRMLTVRGAQAKIAGGELRTEIGRRVPLGEVPGGLLEQLHHPTAGKTLLVME